LGARVIGLSSRLSTSRHFSKAKWRNSLGIQIERAIFKRNECHETKTSPTAKRKPVVIDKVVPQRECMQPLKLRDAIQTADTIMAKVQFLGISL
jgi:hypothetical protein